MSGAIVKIVAAAIKVNGLTMSLPAPARHHHILAAMPAKMARKVVPDEQGFLTDIGTFLSRVQSLTVAREASQLLHETHLPELFSEDLW